MLFNYSNLNPKYPKLLQDMSDRTLKRFISESDTVVKDCNRKRTAGRPSLIVNFNNKYLTCRVIF